ncbi:hypothetical protein [Stenotrophomonas sp. MMGLT7]|uniref:hypothetical protein n=1 Tax=Stenotrophomonas sp. MMGLT7 TaxID=2901227 RepID=UPI002F916B43
MCGSPEQRGDVGIEVVALGVLESEHSEALATALRMLARRETAAADQSTHAARPGVQEGRHTQGVEPVLGLVIPKAASPKRLARSCTWPPSGGNVPAVGLADVAVIKA